MGYPDASLPPPRVNMTTLVTLAAALLAATPKEAVGFRGKVTGVVKSARADGASFVLKIPSAATLSRQLNW